MPKSMFDRGGSGMTRGGLDRFLAPEGVDSSSLPESIENPADPGAREVDCNGADAGSPICELEKAEKEIGDEKVNHEGTRSHTKEE